MLSEEVILVDSVDNVFGCCVWWWVVGSSMLSQPSPGHNPHGCILIFICKLIFEHFSISLLNPQFEGKISISWKDIHYNLIIHYTYTPMLV